MNIELICNKAIFDDNIVAFTNPANDYTMNIICYCNKCYNL